MPEYVDDQRATCECGKAIRWSTLQRKWFHLHNFMTFCTGTAIDEKHVDQPKAQPVEVPTLDIAMPEPIAKC